MRFLTTTLITLMSLASPALAGDMSFGVPMDCTVGETCYIQNYVDVDPSEAASDFTCGQLTYNGHKGTDFALPTGRDLTNNIDVLASAAGVVMATRDGMIDHLQRTKDAPDVTGVECGNGVVIDHGNGWTTQYCHMRQGSLRVQKGDRLEKGAALGYVGLSGKTEFPHVHIVIRKDGKVLDPFGPKPTTTCGQTNQNTLWDDPLAYQSTGLLSVGIAGKVPDYSDVKAGVAQPAELTLDSPAMVVFGFAFGGQQGDVMRLELTGPDGRQIAKNDVTLEKSQARYFRATGRKSSKGWPQGVYRAKVHILRDGTVLDSQSQSITVGP